MNKLIVLLFAVLFCSSANAQDFDLSDIMQGGFSGVSSAEYDEAFDELDSDKNGYLSENELLKFQQNGVGQAEDLTYKVFDADEDGNVSKDEYIAFFKKQPAQNVSETDLTRIFEDMDADKDGNLSPEELKEYRLKHLEAQNREIFKLMDFNQDRKLTKEEFGSFMAFTKSILGNMQGF